MSFSIHHIIANKFLWIIFFLVLVSVLVVYFKFSGTQQKEFNLIRQSELFAAQYFTDTAAASPSSQATANGTKTKERQIFEHTIEENQTLFSIARAYNITVSEIKTHNAGVSAKNLSPGQRIKIPVEAVHTVKAGETLRRIGRQYNIKVDLLAQANGIREGQLKAGQAIVVPIH